MEVRLKTLDGRWEQVGVDRLAEIWPENISVSSNEHGSDTCRFTLRRDAAGIYPDLAAFTPCEILRNGKVIWSGRVWETPTREGGDMQITVEGRGWQYHLDDRAFRLPYVRTRMDFREMRQILNADLNYWKAGAQVSNEGSTVEIGWPKGTAVTTGADGVGVRYDLGPDYEEYWPNFLLTVKPKLTDISIALYVRAHDSEDAIGAGPVGPGTNYEDLLYDPNATYTDPTHFWLVGGIPRRYVSVFLWYEGAGGTFANDEVLQIQQFQVYAKETYRDTLDKSHLRLSDIAMDSIERAAPLIKQPREKTANLLDELKGSPYAAEVWDFGKYEPSPTTGVYGEIYGHFMQLNGAASPEPTVVAGGVDNPFGTETDVGALDFTGVNFLASNDLSIEHARMAVILLFKPDVLPQYGMLAYIGSSGSNGWGYSIGPGAVGSNIHLIRGGVGVTDTGITLTAGTWYLMRAQWNYHFGNMSIDVYDEDGIMGSHTLSASYGAPTNMVYFAGTDGTNEANITIDAGAVYRAPLESYGTNDDTEYMARIWEAALSKKDGNLQRTTFWIPEFPMQQAQTPREVIDAGNSFHDYIWKIDHDPSLSLYPKPASAMFEVGSWSGAEFEEASSNAGEEIYNEVIVEGTNVLGDEMRVLRGGYQTSEQVAFTNPSFESNVTGWSVTVPLNAQVLHDTSVSYSSPASARVDVITAPHTPTVQSSAFTGSFLPGRMYRLQCRMRRTSKANDVGEIRVENTVGSTTEIASKAIPIGGANQWIRVWIDFRFDTIGTINFALQQGTDGTAGAIFYIDNSEVLDLGSSLPSKYGFFRSKILPVNAAMTQTAAERIGDTWLQGRTSTPFKGSLTTKAGGVRYLRTGEEVHPADMLNYTGERIMFSHRTDPDTGDHGREGTIATVTYEDSTGTSTVSIDNTRLSFEALLGRFAAVVGTGR